MVFNFEGTIPIISTTGETAMQHVEVSCERFFSLAGYTSAPHCTRLCVCTYKRSTMLAIIFPKVYIDKKEWVAKGCVRRYKVDAWEKENTVDALKYWNMEFVLDAELQKLPALRTLTLDEFMKEGTTTTKSSTDSSDDVVVDDCSNSGELEC